MNKLNVHRVTTVPAILQLASIYFLEKSGNKADLFITDNSGNRIDIMTDVLINDLIDAKIAALSTLQVVADIAERDGLTVVEGNEAYVLDASADSTVNSGAAKYVYDGTNWVKVSEAESMDIDFASLSIAWSQLTGGPASTPAQIDAAVGNSHNHANLAALNKIGEDGNGDPTYDGNPLISQWATEDF